MDEEVEPAPAPAPAEPEPDPHAQAHERLAELEDQVAGLSERVGALEAEPAEPERTEVVARTDEAEEKKEEPAPADPPAASGERHTGLFI